MMGYISQTVTNRDIIVIPYHGNLAQVNYHHFAHVIAEIFHYVFCMLSTTFACDFFVALESFDYGL